MKGASAFAKATVAKTGGDAYGLTLKILMASVCASGSVMVRGVVRARTVHGQMCT